MSTIGDDSVHAGPASLAAHAKDARITLIDNARAIGIVLVVLGHAPGLSAWASKLIFAFHMPLFFFLSGLVVGSERLRMSSFRRATLLARTLLIPYVFYFGISYLYWLIAKRHGLRAVEFEALAWWNPLTGLVDGKADDLYVNVVLWFFPCLFITATLHHIASKWLSTRYVTVIFCSLAVIFVMTHDPRTLRWWWSSDCAMVAAGFYALGAAATGSLKRAMGFRYPAPLNILVTALTLGACALMTSMNSHVDLSHLEFGDHRVFYLPMALCGTVATLCLAHLIPPTRTAQWLATNTIVIFPLHFLIFSVLTGFAVQILGFDQDFKLEHAGVTLIYLAGGLALSWPAAVFLHRYTPWLFRAGRSMRARA